MHEFFENPLSEQKLEYVKDIDEEDEEGDEEENQTIKGSKFDTSRIDKRKSLNASSTSNILGNLDDKKSKASKLSPQNPKIRSPKVPAKGETGRTRQTQLPSTDRK